MSTPMKPPVMNSGQAWKIMTMLTAIVLRPSMSALYDPSLFDVCPLGFTATISYFFI